jgi:hypothetical protein
MILLSLVGAFAGGAGSSVADTGGAGSGLFELGMGEIGLLGECGFRSCYGY